MSLMIPAKLIPTVLVASGSGTDAESVMRAFRAEQLPHCDIKALLSTVEGAKCLERAENFNIATTVIAKQGKKQLLFEQVITDWLKQAGIKLVFLLGCTHKFPVVAGIDIYNIHPADPTLHGGKSMYGLEPHRHVLMPLWMRLIVGKKQPQIVSLLFPRFMKLLRSTIVAPISCGPRLKFPRP